MIRLKAGHESSKGPCPGSVPAWTSERYLRALIMTLTGLGFRVYCENMPPSYNWVAVKELNLSYHNGYT